MRPPPPPAELCSYCLAMMDASLCFSLDTSVGGEWVETAIGPATGPRAIRRWAEDRLDELEPGSYRFVYADMADVLIPVATAGGDPVCPPHLLELEQGRRYGETYRAGRP